MLPELGHFALILALLLAALQAFFGIAGPRSAASAGCGGDPGGRRPVRDGRDRGRLPDRLLRRNDFSVRYVAENSNSALPLFYRVAALWGAHEGSLLLWIFLLALLDRGGGVRRRAAAAAFRRARARRAGRRQLRVPAVHAGHLQPVPAPGSAGARRPRPQSHPAGPGARHSSADPLHRLRRLRGGVRVRLRGDARRAAGPDWARWTRPWTTAAWAFLTCGIALGSWWAYYELGWGGYWFWDPVENASFMPWLVGTALIHSLAVTDKRGLFKSWTLLLAILAFSLSLLGTFLVRSGVLVSVHSFAADPTRGMFILAFLIIMIGGALTLYAWRAPLLKSQAGFELRRARVLPALQQHPAGDRRGDGVRRHAGAADLRCAGLGTLSVGPPYFNPTFMLSMLPLLALLSVGIHANWKRGTARVTSSARSCCTLVGRPP